ncbi:MAG: sulfite exporter TauE/SafE family protein [Eubacterium sp.]|nr:sulfite exporter TauE/SafE family protein [Eubacterium sp.]
MPKRSRRIQVKGMFCEKCERRISRALLNLPGVLKANASFKNADVEVIWEPDRTDEDSLYKAIEEAGYEPVLQEVRRDGMIQTASILIILLSLYMIADHMGWTGYLNIFPKAESTISLSMVFVIGLLTSVHCVAMCGGINLAQSTTAARRDHKIFRSNVSYQAGRVISYTIIGAIVGGVGSVLRLNGLVRGFLPILAGMVMIIMALNMLGLFRSLHSLTFHLPAGVYGRVIGWFGGQSSFVIGLLNGLMPCGPLQSMQLYALTAGSAIRGALSMLLFGAGTVPLMLGFGYLAGSLNRRFSRYMLTVSAFLIFIMGIHMTADGFSLSGIRLPSIHLPGQMSGPEAAVINDEGEQQVRTEIDYGSYPAIKVKRGIPVEWTIHVPEGKLNGCNGEILIPAYNLDIVLMEGDNRVSFLPEKTGTIPYSCWMGMIKSTIEVTE